MNRAHQLLEAIRGVMRGHDRFSGEPLPKLQRLRGSSWRVYCGDGRYDPSKGNAAVSRSTGIALNFQITGEGETIGDFEVCAAWPLRHDAARDPQMPASASSFWCLMFHLDPQREHWPDHPRFHVQLAAPADGGIPPFLAWRIPCAQEQEPHRLVEFLVHHIVEEPRHPSGEPGA